MSSFPETLIPARQEDLRGAAQQVAQDLTPEQRQEAAGQALKKAKEAGEKGDFSSQLDWEAVAEGFRG